MSDMKAILEWLMEDDADWSDPNVVGLAKLLLDNMHTCFRHAIKMIADEGHTEEEAEKMILTCGPTYGTKDMLSDMVEQAITYHKTNHNKGTHISKSPVFDNLEEYVEYTMVETVVMVRALNPSLSVYEAIWSLLVCDLHLLNAHNLEMDPCNFFISSAKEGTSAQTPSQSGPMNQETMIEKVDKPDTLKPQSSRSGEKTDQRCARCQRWCPEPVCKRGPTRKSIHSDKNSKGQMSKRAAKKELALLADLGLDETPCPCESSSVNNEVLDPVSAAVSSSSKAETVAPDHPITADYLSSIPYDESKGEHVALDEKDRMILAGVSLLESLQKEHESWNDWAAKKVMQVAKKLSHERPELDSLRAEKEEAGKLKENSAKKILEMTSALTEAQCKDAMADADKVELNKAKLALKQELEAARMRSVLEAMKLKKALRKEQDSIKKCNSIGTEKSLLEKELKALKCEASSTQLELENAKQLLAQTKINLANDERETTELRKQAELIRNERERLEALAKAEEERIVKKAEKELKSYQKEMKRVEGEISVLKLEAETKKVAAMLKDLNWEGCKGTKTSDILQSGVESGSMRKKKYGECVICLSEVANMVFAPCRHQVLCVECNRIHALNGMDECPTCRAPIQDRLDSRSAKS